MEDRLSYLPGSFTMNEVLDTGKCVVCVAAGLAVALGLSVGALAVVLNIVKVLLF